jgi:translation initiation factor IF-2
MQSHPRPPIIAIMGHVDHGKSSLLDYIRSANTVSKEAGGITQYVSAYEATHFDKENNCERNITFIDTPGHAAFMGMRKRGAAIADIAILIISAEDSIMPQTIEALTIIKEADIPFLVAINKIDKPNANPDKIKMDLMSHEVFLEGYGGNIPFAEISAKTGAGISDLLDTILLLSDLEEFTGMCGIPADGFIIESHSDPKRGNSGTLIIKNGTIEKNKFIVAGKSIAPTRMIQDFLGNSLESATFSSPVTIIGFDSPCPVGVPFFLVDTKAQAENLAKEYLLEDYQTIVPLSLDQKTTKLVPVILRCDVAGMIEAVVTQVELLSNDRVFFKIIKAGVGDINESDIRLALSDSTNPALIMGFNVKEDKQLERIPEKDQLSIVTFDIIYKMKEWLEEKREDFNIKQTKEEILSTTHILKVFSRSKTKGTVAGGKVTSGEVTKDYLAKIMRGDQLIAICKILDLQEGKSPAKKVELGSEFGFLLDTDKEIEDNDTMITFKTVTF